MKWAQATVLRCGCRLFPDRVVACEKHDWSPRAERIGKGLFLFVKVAVVTAIVVYVFLSMQGCAVDMGGIGDASENLGRGTADAGTGGMGGATMGLPLDGAASDAGSVVSDSGGHGGNAVPPDSGTGIGGQGGVSPTGVPRCPRTAPIGCVAGELVYVEGPAVCCIPVDWEGYKGLCPTPVAGCRWVQSGAAFGGVCCI